MIKDYKIFLVTAITALLSYCLYNLLGGNLELHNLIVPLLAISLSMIARRVVKKGS